MSRRTSERNGRERLEVKDLDPARESRAQHGVGFARRIE